jgi:hypothetical protein
MSRLKNEIRLLTYLLANPISILQVHVLRKIVCWQESEDVEYPYKALVEGVEWKLKLNDFPAEPIFTLYIDGQRCFDIDDPPPTWGGLQV